MLLACRPWGARRVGLSLDTTTVDSWPPADLLRAAIFFEARDIMQLSRDWWAVVLAVTAALFVKLGALPHVPW